MVGVKRHLSVSHAGFRRIVLGSLCGLCGLCGGVSMFAHAAPGQPNMPGKAVGVSATLATPARAGDTLSNLPIATAPGPAVPLDPLAAPAGATATPAPAMMANAAKQPVLTTADDDLTPDGRRQILSFKQLGALDPLQLRGIDGQNGVAFAVRADEVVTRATLHLIYSYSPALLPNVSHLKVLINGEVVSTLPVPHEQAGMLVSRDIPIEPRFVTEFNNLNVQLIGHYTPQCEDPAHSSLWATVSNASTLDVTYASLPAKADLSDLPLPFFDRRDVRRLELPFVFAGTPDNATLEAAGAVASWFGALAGYRGAVFPAQLDTIPATGNVVVFATPQQHPGLISLPEITGPGLRVVARAAPARGSILMVLGRNPAELKTAAAALTLGQAALSGDSATITRLQPLKTREPYDAPNWLASDRPVHFGELTTSRDLRMSGYYADAIRINSRMPPDLFTWRTRGVPIDLKYRYTVRPAPDKSTLNVSLNDSFIQAMRIPAGSASMFDPGRWINRVLPDNTAEAERVVHIPPTMLTSHAQLRFHFYYEMPKTGNCQGIVLDNVRGEVDPDSTIDLSSFPHWMALPDLAAFSNSGFPFTRLADLSATAVVLPDQPRADDYSMYLMEMGRMGESTGYPVTGVTVAQAANVDSVANKDLLVLGGPERQSLLNRWRNAAPFAADGESTSFKVSDVALKLNDWWYGPNGPVRAPGQADLSLVGNGNDAMIVGFQSPLQNDRSVVAIVSSGGQSNRDLVNAILDPDLVSEIQGGLTIIHGRTITPISNGAVYYVGQLSPIEYLRWAMSIHPLLLVLFGCLAALVLAVFAYRALRSIAGRRLRD
jgi:hypothetical protein